MAAYEKQRISELIDTQRVVWTLTSADATGVGVELPEHADKCWQVYGTWGGATATIQGANVDVEAQYFALKNAVGGADVAFTADAVPKNTVESSLFVRPKLTAAGVGATVTVVLIARRQPRY
jgi:hypothetical protein